MASFLLSTILNVDFSSQLLTIYFSKTQLLLHIWPLLYKHSQETRGDSMTIQETFKLDN